MTNHQPMALVREKLIERTAKKLEENHMTAYYAPTLEDARKLVQELLPKGCTVACGGSMTLSEAGIMDLLRSGRAPGRGRPGSAQGLFCRLLPHQL